jgi:DHA3 family macrolide efflux protein-like MFS transporter
MLVPDNWLERVAGLNQILQGLTTIAAAPLGALLLAFLPFQGALLVDVVTALLGVAPLLVFVVPQIQRTDTHESGLWSDFVIGARVVLHNRGLLLLFGLATLVVLAIMPTFTLMPLLVKEYFRGGVNDVAFLGSLSGVGIIAGSVLITVMPLFRRRIVTILVAFALSCALIACTALAPSSMLWLATIFWALSGLAFAAGNAPLLALIQKQVPNQVQGRVIAILGALMGLAAPVGLGLVALFSGVVGVRGIFIIGGLSAATLCLFGFAAPSLIRIEETAVRPE